jgi:hypothetical protein
LSRTWRWVRLPQFSGSRDEQDFQQIAGLGAGETLMRVVGKARFHLTGVDDLNPERWRSWAYFVGVWFEDGTGDPPGPWSDPTGDGWLFYEPVLLDPWTGWNNVVESPEDLEASAFHISRTIDLDVRGNRLATTTSQVYITWESFGNLRGNVVVHFTTAVGNLQAP